MSLVGRVAELWRFPVKSARGERVPSVRVGERGVEGDRAWGIATRDQGMVLSAKRDASLLGLRAWTEPDGRICIELPDGTIVEPPEGADAISKLLGREVDLRSAGVDAKYDLPEDFQSEGKGRSIHYPCPPGTLFDIGIVHVVTTSTLRSLGDIDVRRFRPNVLIETSADGFPEDEWIGKVLEIGAAKMSVDSKMPRCVMTTHEQGELPKDRGVLKTVVTANQTNAGIFGAVVQTGEISEGDEVRLV